MCCGVTGGALMVRMGAEARERGLAEPHVRPMEFGGRVWVGLYVSNPQVSRQMGLSLSGFRRASTSLQPMASGETD